MSSHHNIMANKIYFLSHHKPQWLHLGIQNVASMSGGP